jgi:uncharacterized protein (DUF4415 family)
MKRKSGSKSTLVTIDSRTGRVISGPGRGRVPKDRTDWERLRKMKGAGIRFTRDAPRTTPADWADAVAHIGLPAFFRKKQIALRIDEDVLEWFKAQGPGYQTRMNAVLREFRNAHRR